MVKFGPFVVLWGLLVATLWAASVRSHTRLPWELAGLAVLAAAVAVVAFLRA